jgi:hypothetical protein
MSSSQAFCVIPVPSPCCDVRNDFCVITIIDSSLLPMALQSGKCFIYVIRPTLFPYQMLFV